MNTSTEVHVLDLIPVVVLTDRPAAVDADPEALRALVYRFVLASSALREYAARVAAHPSLN